MLIDKTYFKNEIQIPNANEVVYGNDVLEDLIQNKSYSFLLGLLGIANVEDLRMNLDDDLKLKTDAPSKWLDLVNGVAYNHNDTKKHFKGLIQTNGIYKESIIADYVFVHWLINSRSQQTEIGEVVVQAQNGINVNSTPKLIQIWNKFFKSFFGGNYNHLGNHYFVNGVPFSDYYNGDNQFVSVVEFLNDRKDVYGNCPCSIPLDAPYQGFINHLGI